MESIKKKFAVIGHVDTGKSTTLGHLIYQTNNISDHEMDNIRREAEQNGKKKFCYAYLMDTDKSERNRGVTEQSNIIDISYNNISYQIIDTPGHKIYIKEMIETLSMHNDATVCVLVSCIENEFNTSMNEGTTKEDILLARGCDIKNLVILINKIDTYDLDDVEKVKKNYDNIINTINNFAGKLGFNSINYVPISGYEGWNLVKPNDKINDILKPKHQTLIECINSIKQNFNKEKDAKHFLSERIEKNKIKVQLNILNINSIITTGYKCILHIVDNNEISQIEGEFMVITDLQKNKKQFINNGDKVLVGLKLNDSLKVYEGNRIIFRNNDYTIGFGKIMFT